MSDPTPADRQPRKSDRSVIPSVAAIAACVMFAYGFGNQSVFWQWIMPALVVVASLVYSYLVAPRRKRFGAA